jgi:hypothetical protein
VRHNFAHIAQSVRVLVLGEASGDSKCAGSEAGLEEVASGVIGVDPSPLYKIAPQVPAPKPTRENSRANFARHWGERQSQQHRVQPAGKCLVSGRMTSLQRRLRAAFGRQQISCVARIGRAGANQNRASEGNSWKLLLGPSARPQIDPKLLLDYEAGSLPGVSDEPVCPMKKTFVRLTTFYPD